MTSKIKLNWLSTFTYETAGKTAMSVIVTQHDTCHPSTYGNYQINLGSTR